MYIENRRGVKIKFVPERETFDLAGLLAAGYSIARLVMIDLFPQTFHLESIVQLKR